MINAEICQIDKFTQLNPSTKKEAAKL